MLICRKTRGFSLIEILVTITIIVLLIAIILPAMRKAREIANRTSCAANLLTWGQASLLFAKDHRGFFPAAWGFGNGNAQSSYPKYGISQDPVNGCIFPMILNNDSADENTSQYGADWRRFGTPYATFLQYGGTGSTSVMSAFGTPVASALSGPEIPYISGLNSRNWGYTGYDPTTWGLDNGLSKAPSPSAYVRLAPWMICPSSNYQSALYAGDQPGDWGYWITDTYMYVGGTVDRTRNSFQQLTTNLPRGSLFAGQGMVETSGYNGALVPTWGNRINEPATTDQDSPQSILAADAVAWGGNNQEQDGVPMSGQGNMYLINHPSYSNPDVPSFQNILYADGHVSGISFPTFYDYSTGQNSNNLTGYNWAMAHMPPLNNRPSLFSGYTGGNSYLNVWNYNWAGWYFYWPNQPGGD